jgi:hypothetical protein
MRRFVFAGFISGTGAPLFYDVLRPSSWSCAMCHNFVHRSDYSFEDWQAVTAWMNEREQGYPEIKKIC